MEQAIEQASHPDSQETVHGIVQYGLGRSTARSALHVLQYVLDRGADAEKLYGKDVLPVTNELNEDEKPSIKVLDILIAHGWNINNRGDSWPILWSVVKYPDLIRWALDHGASVDIPDRPSKFGCPHDPPQFSANGTEIRHSAMRGPVTVLGVAASTENIETFELLRERDAPLDTRMLHIVVQSAVMAASNEAGVSSQDYQDRMALVRLLVDVVGLDANAIEHQVGDHCSTPLCYVAGPRLCHEGHRELINFSLDSGADPDLDCGSEGGTKRNILAKS